MSWFEWKTTRSSDRLDGMPLTNGSRKASIPRSTLDSLEEEANVLTPAAVLAMFDVLY